ncbi:polyprenyl glycosylphosphotransferase [Marinitoga sp. 1137]|uniref:sugar transferase n=1 Tax=Marinitoga sp. 1137 TaxID=1545835 RepID=UPI000950724F|nr:sugar transferase [Marinitoga sp. 1137]APT76073.1 polyprenyl glycosylphosphotransferase [Marinitoga sp. 1137]
MRKLPKIIDIIIIFAINLLLFKYNWYISSLISISLFLGFYAFRTYDLDTMNSLNESVIRIFAGFMLGSIILLMFYPLIEKDISRYTFIHNMAIAIIIFPLIHKTEYKLFEKHAQPKRYLVIGRKNEIGHILDEIQQKTLNKLQFVDYINPSPIRLEELVKDGFSEKEKNRINKIINFTYKQNTSKYDAILVTDPKLEEIVKDKLEEYKTLGIPIEHLPNIAEKYLKRIPLEVIEKFKEYYSIIFENDHESPAKRILDIIGSSIALIIFSPFMLLTTILIYLEDGKPIVFKQERVGKNEQPFTMHKFRSMKNVKTDGPKFADDEKDRILKVGKIIRPIRIDETLQFLNILKGDMSIVGPRPEQIPFVKQFNKQIPYYYARHKVKPGLTGWAQIMYKYASTEEEIRKKLSYDLYYVKNRSTLFDLRIILQTIETVLWKRGAM